MRSQASVLVLSGVATPPLQKPMWEFFFAPWLTFVGVSKFLCTVSVQVHALGAHCLPAVADTPCWAPLAYDQHQHHFLLLHAHVDNANYPMTRS